MASILNVDQINNAAGTSAVTIDASTGKPSFPNGMTLPSGVGGKVLQATSGRLNGTPAVNSGGSTWVDVFSASITPSSTTSKIIMMVTVMAYQSSAGADGNVRVLYSIGGGAYNPVNPNTSPLATNSTGTLFGNYRGGDEIYQGAIQAHWTTLHEVSTTSTVTYKVQGISEATLTFNRGFQTGQSRFGNPVSELVLMEIAG